MLIWIILALVLMAVVVILALPFMRKNGPSPKHDADYALAIYRDQLQELDRDLARGQIAAPEADAARNEISRRLLQAAQTEAEPERYSLSRLGWISLLLVPIIAIPLYLRMGSLDEPDVPHAARLQLATENKDIPAMVMNVELHLAQQPNDVKAWRLLAPVYQNQQRWDDAANAYRKMIELSPPTADSYSQLGYVLMAANDGMVVPEAKDAFVKALSLDPKNPVARFYEAIALKQDGKREEARVKLRAFLAASPADAPWRPMLEAEIKDIEQPKVPALSAEQLAAGQNMTPEQQAAMINSMMDRLEQKLQANPNDIEGWQRLIRARKVSGNVEKAQQALATARETFKSDTAAIGQLNSLAKELELQ